MRRTTPLTALAVARMTDPGRYAVGDGAYLQIAAGGTKSWVFRYQRDGKARHMGLGPFDLVTLAEAREKARDARRLLLNGTDPLEAKATKRRQASLAAAQSVTFKHSAERYIASHAAGWRNPKHKAQWTATLEAYAFPVFGDVPVQAVDVGLITKVLEPIWATKSETASRVRGRIEAVLDWAKARGYRDGENPARWRGHLDKLLPARRKVRKVEHHAALPYVEMPDFMAALRQREGAAARALEFAILTAGRTGEVIGAKWCEIDLEACMWTIPASRMKAGREHRVPLSDRAIDILQGLALENGNEFVFAGAREKQALSNMALLMTLRRMGRDDLTVHGFRSSFRDWAAEQTRYPNEVVEMALAHSVSNAVEAAYRRGDLFDKRRRLMADWVAFCAEPLKRGDAVPFRRRTALNTMA